MREKTTNKISSGIHVGSATLVMLFSVLCLTIFAVLATITAENSWTLAEKSADAVTKYYEVDYQAVQYLDEIIANYDGYFVLPKEVECYLEWVNGQEYLSYWVPMDENQQLWVQLCASEGTIQVVHWEVETIGEWEADQTLTLLDPWMF